MNNGTLVPFVVRWWWVLLLGMLIAAGVGYGAATQITKTYEAETQLLVGPLNTTFDLDASGTLARTYAQLGEGRPVLAAAIKATGTDMTPKALDKASTIESNEITRIISVRVQDTDPVLAARLANAIGAELVDLSSERRARTGSGLDAFAREPEVAGLPTETRDGIVSAAERVFSNSVAGRLHVTEAAQTPHDPVKPSVPLIVILSAVAGLMIAAAVGLVWESLNGEQRGSSGSPTVPPQPFGPTPDPNTPARDPWGALISESRREIRAGDR